MFDGTKSVSVFKRFLVFKEKTRVDERTWFDKLVQKLFHIKEPCAVLDVELKCTPVRSGPIWRVGLTLWPLTLTEPVREDNWDVRFASFVICRRTWLTFCIRNLTIERKVYHPQQ